MLDFVTRRQRNERKRAKEREREDAGAGSWHRKLRNGWVGLTDMLILIRMNNTAASQSASQPVRGADKNEG
jgi:hypothetical protein